MINTVLSGDLVNVTKSGADPTWTCRAEYDKDQQPFDVPYLQAYATRDGKTRGVIVFNLHRTESLPVVLRFPGKVKPGTAIIRRMEADKIDANNEPGHDPQVRETSVQPANFASESALTLKPFSMVVVRWEEQ